MFKKFVAGVVFWLAGVSAASAGYPLFVPVEDVAVQYINGAMRFCPKANLRGVVCGQDHKLFGKKRFVAGDWWTPETYVEAVLAQNVQGTTTFQIIGVEPGYTQDSLVIYFEVQDETLPAE